MFARLLIIGAIVAVVAADITVDDAVTDGNAGGSVKVDNCMTANTPIQAAEKASKQAYAAASSRKTEVATAADLEYTKASASADRILAASKANSLAAKNAAVRASNLKKAEMVAEATARAKADLAAALEKIGDLRREAEQRVVAKTHQKMKAIQADHQATIEKEKQDLMKVQKDAAKNAHDKKAGDQNTELALTKQKFADANTEHQKALALAFSEYVIGKKKAEVDSAALKLSLETRATKAQTDETKIIGDTFTKQAALALSEYNAAKASAAAKKADQLATASGEMKQAEMQAWVDTMSHEIQHATLCTGDKLSAAGAAMQAGIISKHTAANGAITSRNSGMNDMGYNENAAISLQQKAPIVPSKTR